MPERLIIIGNKSSAAKPSIGLRITGLNKSSKLGYSFRSNTSPTPTPIHVKTIPPGIMPIIVVQIKLKSLTPTIAGKIFAKKKGNDWNQSECEHY